MSIGLDCIIEVKNPETGKWEWAPNPDDNGIFSYESISFLTGFKNEEHRTPVLGEQFQYRGYPKDSDWLNEEVKGAWGPESRLSAEIKNDNDFAVSWVLLGDLVAYDYETVFEDRYDMGWPLKGETKLLPEGAGKQTTMRAFLGDWFFTRIEYLKTLGEPENVRIIFNLS